MDPPVLVIYLCPLPFFIFPFFCPPQNDHYSASCSKELLKQVRDRGSRRVLTNNKCSLWLNFCQQCKVLTTEKSPKFFHLKMALFLFQPVLCYVLIPTILPEECTIINERLCKSELCKTSHHVFYLTVLTVLLSYLNTFGSSTIIYYVNLWEIFIWLTLMLVSPFLELCLLLLLIKNNY